MITRLSPIAAYREGLRRVTGAPWMWLGAWLATLLVAVPAAMVVREMIADHLGASLVAERVAAGVDVDWWQEFRAQASGLGATFVPAIVGGAAVLKNHGALAIGNILGSNIFNLLGILGIVAIVQPIGISRETLIVDFPAVVLMQVICIPLLLRRNRVGRREGVALLGLYAVYAAIVFGFGR